MARRRLNTRFLWITVTVAGVAGVGGAVAFKFMTRARPQQFINAARIAEQQQQWDVAVQNLSRAAGLMPRDAVLRVELGEALDKLSVKDPADHDAAIAAWTQATEIDPSNVPARELLVNAYEKQLTELEAQPKTDKTLGNLAILFQNVNDQASELARIDPKNTHASWVIPSLTVRRWLLQMPLPLSAAEAALPPEQRPTDQQKVDAAVAQLTQVLHENPTSAAGYWIARAKVHEAQQALADGRPATADTLFQSAAAVYDDALAHKPANPSPIYANKAQVMSLLLSSDPRADQHARYQAGMEDALDHAQATADPKDLANYDNLKLRWAQILAAKDPAAAEKIYQDLIAKNPPIEMIPRLDLARMLANIPSRRAEAIAQLDQLPSTAPVDLPPSRQMQFASELLNAKFLRAQILFIMLRSSDKPAERAALGEKVQALLTELAQNPTLAQDWRFLGLKGQFQMAQNHPREAAQTLTAALDKLHAQSSGQSPELLMQLAGALRATGQNAAAVSVLEPAMGEPALANSPGAHLLLAEMYLEQHDTAHMQPHMDWLKKHEPDAPEVISLEIQTLDPAADKDAIAALYAKLPETTLAQQANKAAIAQRDGDQPEVIRLLKIVYAKNPNNVAAARQLARSYVAIHQKDQAQAILADAMKQNPGDSSLVLLSQMINGASGKSLEQAEVKAEQHQNDPFSRELGLADAAHLGNDSAGELKHLQAAYALRATDRAVQNRLFSLYLTKGQFDAAHAMLEGIASSDADDNHGELASFRYDLARRDKDATLADAQKLVNDLPEFASSWDALGTALELQGRYADAVGNFQHALTKQANDADALRSLVQCSYQLGKTDDAKHYITLARSEFPDVPEYRDWEVRHEILYGSPDSLVPSLQQAISEHPDNPQNYQWEARCLIRSAELDVQHNDPDAATTDLQKAHDVLQLASTRWPDDLAFAAALAGVQLKQNDLPGGVSTLQAIAARPAWKNKAEPQIALAELYLQNGQPDQAIAPLRTALIQSDYAAPVEVKLASVLSAQGHPDQALTVLDAHQNDATVLSARVDTLMALHRGDDAENEIKQAKTGFDAAAQQSHATTAPTDAMLNDMLASVYYREGKYDLVRNLTGQAIAADPNDVQAQYFQGLLALRPPVDAAAAVAHLSVVRDQNPNDVPARMALSDADLLRNDRDAAIQEVQAALTAAPDNKAVRLKLVDLYNAAAPPRLLQAQQTLDQGLLQPSLRNDPDLLRQKALVLARSGQPDEAVATIRDAMARVPDKSVLVRDYLNVLLLTHNDNLLLQESDPLVADATKAPWWAYDLRARAKNQSGDRDGATADFDSALTAAAAQDHPADGQATSAATTAATIVAKDAATELGPDGALALVLPRAQNDTGWKLIALTLEQSKGDHAAAIRMAESAMATMGTLPLQQQEQLLEMAGAMYLTADPPQPEQAASAYEQLLKRRPDDLIAMNNLACVLADEVTPARPQDALKYSQQAFDRAQQTGQVVPTIYDTQGWVLILAGHVDQGISVLQKIGSDAQLPEVHYHLAEGMMRKALPQSARRELQLASDLLDQAAAANRQVDQTLRPKVDAAMKQVQKMIDAKAQATE